MVHLEEIAVTGREGEIEERGRLADGEPSTRTGKDVERRGQDNRSGAGDFGSGSTSGWNRGDSKVDANKNTEKAEQSAIGGQKEDLPPTTEDYQARFYEIYRQKAEHHDKEFIKKYDEDLNTSLIFAGLFSAVASAFIIEVNSELKPDPNEETAALLRVLIHKIDNTTFGGDVPVVPQWTGPPRTIVHVQAILFASLTASLFSALLAMLGKQWLNRYESVDMEGSAVERSQNRQRKLDGIVAWYFDQVMQSLPLMLQAALLLLGCALSRYLWEINTTVATVVIGVTSFGVLFYLFIVIAGTASVSCPYQTPGAHILRRILRWIPRIPATLYLALSTSIEESTTYEALDTLWECIAVGPHSFSDILSLLPLLLLPFGLIEDACRLTSWLLIICYRRMHLWLRRVSELPMTALDLHCISWILQTSLDGPVRLLTLNYLAITTSADPDPTLTAGCFKILTSCIKVIGNEATVTQGTEQLAPAAVLCCLHTLSNLIVADPALRALGNIRQQYDRIFPPNINIKTLPFPHTLNSINRILHPGPWHGGRSPQWEDYKPSSNEHAVVAHALAKTSQYQRLSYRRMYGQHEKVPRWLLRFVLYSLSQSPLPSTSVVINCLSIITIDLECGLVNTVTSDESVSLDEVSLLIIQKLKSMVEDPNLDVVSSKSKAISALFPYAVSLLQDGQQQMVDAISHAASASRSERFMWHRVKPFIVTMFKRPNPPSLTWVLGLISTSVHWHTGPHDKHRVASQAAATSATSNPGVCWSVADELLHIAFFDVWRRRYKHLQRPEGTGEDITHQVRTLGDIEILKSHLILALSGGSPIRSSSEGLSEMLMSIWEDFSRVGVGCHRDDLIKKLAEIESPNWYWRDLGGNHINWDGNVRIDWDGNRMNWDGSHINWALERCRELKRVLLEVDILTRSHSAFMCALPLPCP